MKIRAALIVLCLVMASGCAMRRDVVFLDERIDAVETLISKQKTSTDEADTAIRKEYAKLSNDVDNLTEQVRQFDGRADEKLYAIEKKTVTAAKLKTEMDRMEALITDLTLRLANLEKTMAYEKAEAKKIAASSLSAVDGSSSDNASPPDTKLYDDALKGMEKNDTKGAREKLAALIKDYPNSKHVDNAQFWIGETYYREKWYQKAILEYQKVIENHPRGIKVPAAYLKQGLAFFELKEADNAKLILNQLVKKYPDSAEAAVAKKKLGK